MKKLNLNLFKFFILLFFTLCNSAHSEVKFVSSNIEKVIITDGDSLKIGKEKIRLFGIDAPELKQVCNHNRQTSSGVVKKIPYACGEASKSYLKEILNAPDYEIKIFCYYSKVDKYERLLAECFLGETSAINVNFEMVRRGHAVAYLRYSDKYLKAQEFAKKHELGIWKGDFEMPEEWRKKNK